jgi:hypothetical protein
VERVQDRCDTLKRVSGSTGFSILLTDSLSTLFGETTMAALQGKRPASMKASAQAGDIEEALKKAGLWNKTNEIAPLLNQAGVPEDAKVFIRIKVDKRLNVKILVKTKPDHKSARTLEGKLNQLYASKMKAALQKQQLEVADTIELAWINF